MAEPLTASLAGADARFAPRAEWVLSIIAEALGRALTIVDGPADIAYATGAPSRGLWIPAQPEAQAFFESGAPFPGDGVHRSRGLTLLWPPSEPAAAIPGDIVASAFYLLARWDELRVSERDRFGRLALAESAFGRMAGLDLEDPPVEGYIAAVGAGLGLPPPRSWSVFLTHDIDRLRRRTPRGIASELRAGGVSALAALARRDPWANIPDLLWTSGRRGLAPTVFFIGRNAHALDGSPRRIYERERARLARAVRAAGGEVGLHGAFASSEGREALAEELAILRGEAGEIAGVRFHYLRFRYHESVPQLEGLGLEYDASLGFSEAPGFACGIARPFRPWIVGEERPADLRVVPLAVMDTTLHSALGLDAAAARERALGVLERVRDAGGAAALLWHNTYLADARAPGYGALWEELLDELLARGARLGPIRPPEREPVGADLTGRRVLHLTSVHRPRDVRIFHKHVAALRAAGADARVGGFPTPVPRARRLLAGWRLARRARREGADVIHVHDPELLPAALWLARTSDARVLYDVHEYLGETTRTKPWLPEPVRRPLSWLVERAEKAAARRLDGTVTVNGDLGARFAVAGARTRTVTNAPWGAAFESPAPLPAAPEIIYVGGLVPARGLDLMRAAFPLIDVPGVHLVLAGPGEPGPLPDGVEHLGAVDHAEVPALLAAARVAWIPLQRHGNYDRAVPTKLVEAMAAGRPVVASALGRLAPLVADADCGLLVPPDDPAAHAGAIRRLLQDDDLARRLGENGRTAFERDLRFERQAAALTDFYREILGT